MNYQEMESLFRQEQLQLHHQLDLRPQAIDPVFFKQHWQPVREVNVIHRLGSNLAFVYGTIALLLGFVQWEALHASLPLLLGGVAMFANGWLLPPRSLPTENLERYSVTELITQIIDFRQYALNRAWADCLVVVIFFASLLIGILNFFYGINVFLQPELVPTRFWFFGVFALLFPVIGGVAANNKHLRQLKEIEHQLAGYREEDLV